MTHIACAGVNFVLKPQVNHHWGEERAGKDSPSLSVSILIGSKLLFKQNHFMSQWVSLKTFRYLSVFISLSASSKHEVLRWRFKGQITTKPFLTLSMRIYTPVLIEKAKVINVSQYFDYSVYIFGSKMNWLKKHICQCFLCITHCVNKQTFALQFKIDLRDWLSNEFCY